MLASVERLIAEPDRAEYLLGAPGPDAPAEAVCQLRFRHSVWTGSDDAWLEDLYVTEAARGTGLGRALTEHAMARARDRGCARIQLDVNTANEPAHRLYRSLGFSSYADPPGGDNLMMGRRLS